MSFILRVFQWIIAFPTVCDLIGSTLGGEENFNVCNVQMCEYQQDYVQLQKISIHHPMEGPWKLEREPWQLNKINFESIIEFLKGWGQWGRLKLKNLQWSGIDIF